MDDTHDSNYTNKIKGKLMDGVHSDLKMKRPSKTTGKIKYDKNPSRI
jgi:hypothetical protein